VLARREGVDPALRTSFTRAGVAHLLAISGFHVGIVAALVLGLLRAGGVRRRPAAVAGAAAVGAYVAFIGAPDAAVRAALLLGLVGAGVVRGRPVHRAGALATGLLLFVVGDPGAPTRPGFQLSFLGAGGLVFLAPVLDRALLRRLRWARARGSREAVAVGIAATLATLPAVAWHFGEVSAVGIPATLAGTPLVAVAIPGILVTLAADALPLVPGAVAHFLAGGTDLLLVALVRVVGAAGALPWATVTLPRGLLAAGAMGSVAGAILLPPARDVGRDVRLATTGLGALGAAVLLGPLGAMLGGGGVEIVALDVGQGDAVAVRSPDGRWLLVDAGPPAPPDARDPPPAVARLKARGVPRLEGLLLTHPDLDHIGGAAAAIEAFGPRFVGGPGHVRGTEAYVDGLERAGGADERIPWLELRAGDRLDLDGVEIRVLHPSEDPAPGDEPNASSLVLLVTWGGFRALLTGDAPAEVEDRLAEVAGDVDLLKVAHHGSRTSTSRAFLDVVLPEVALVSAGRHNRYGHPHAEVLERLGSVSERLLRTDRDGTLRVLVGRDGSWRLRTGPGWLGW
jgi:competence protein ComEC